MGAGSGHHCLARFTLDGHPLAGAQLNVPIRLEGVSPQGFVVLSGDLLTHVDFGCGPLEPGARAKAFVAVLTPTSGP